MKVRNFTESWKDGLAFLALIHKHHPELFDYKHVLKTEPKVRLAQAFGIAASHLGIDKLLEPEDVYSDHIDKRSVMTYVMCLFQAFPHENIPASIVAEESPPQQPTSTPKEKPVAAARRASTETVSSTRSTPSTASSETLKFYHTCLEDTLTRLLEAEERLLGFESISEKNLKLVKKQFVENEVIFFSSNFPVCLEII